MRNAKLEVSDVFAKHSDYWQTQNKANINLDQLRAIRAILNCRTSALGGHIEQCTSCDHQRIAYNSCRNRHCPKCQWSAATRWLEQRQAELLEVPYYHVVFTLPAAIGNIAFQNKVICYKILFQAASQALQIIAGDPKHLGAKIGITSVLHTWGQSLQHHPHIHCIVPGGGIAVDNNNASYWKPCKPGFFLSVRVLSRLFKRLYLEKLNQAYKCGVLKFYNALAPLCEHAAFEQYLKPCRKAEWVVYAKRPFAGPSQVLKYLSRYTHRVAISNSRLVSLKNGIVTFKWKDYRTKDKNQQKHMRVTANDFMRRFLLHILPSRFHRIRHHGLFANSHRAQMVAKCRRLIAVKSDGNQHGSHEDKSCDELGDTSSNNSNVIDDLNTCPCCGGDMIIVEVFERPTFQSQHQAKYWTKSCKEP